MQYSIAADELAAVLPPAVLFTVLPSAPREMKEERTYRSNVALVTSSSVAFDPPSPSPPRFKMRRSSRLPLSFTTPFSFELGGVVRRSGTDLHTTLFNCYSPNE